MNNRNNPNPGSGLYRHTPQGFKSAFQSQAGLYTGFGLAGAAIGVLAGGLGSRLTDWALKTFGVAFISESFKTVLLTGLQLGILSGAIGFALFLAKRRYRYGAFGTQSVVKVAGLSFLAGAFAGSSVQTLYNGWSDSRESSAWVVDVGTWLLLGALLGAVMAVSAPRLSLIPAIGAGVSSGLIAGLVRLALSGLGVSAAVLAICGSIAFGAAIGLLTFLIERGVRDAAVEVHWSPQEITTVGLGARPVTIGGGADDIFLEGAPPRVSTLVMRDGAIEHIETSTGKRTALKDGSRLRIGGLVMVVHARGQ